jgi:hypothetical protein
MVFVILVPVRTSSGAKTAVYQDGETDYTTLEDKTGLCRCQQVPTLLLRTVCPRHMISISCLLQPDDALTVPTGFIHMDTV